MGKGDYARLRFRMRCRRISSIANVNMLTIHIKYRISFMITYMYARQSRISKKTIIKIVFPMERHICVYSNKLYVRVICKTASTRVMYYDVNFTTGCSFGSILSTLCNQKRIGRDDTIWIPAWQVKCCNHLCVVRDNPENVGKNHTYQTDTANASSPVRCIKSLNILLEW